MTAGRTVVAPTRATLDAIRAVVVDYVAFDRDEMVVADELVVSGAVAGGEEEPTVREALALVVALAVEEGGRSVGELVEAGELGPAEEVSEERVASLLQRGRELDDFVVAGEWLAMACWGCGCSDDRACEDGCYWIVPNLCSACTGERATG